MLTDAFIHAFIITREIVNMDLVAISLTLLKGRLSDQSHQKKLARDFIKKTTAQMVTNANILMI